MARSYSQPGNVLTITAAGSITSGDPVVVGALVGVALNSAVLGETVDVRLDGVFRLPCVSGDAITQGAKLYLDGGNVTLDPDGSSNPAIGFAWEAAGNGVTSVAVRLAN